MTPKKYKVLGISTYSPKNSDKSWKILHCVTKEYDKDGNFFVATVFVESDSKIKINDIVNLLYFSGRYNLINF